MDLNILMNQPNKRIYIIMFALFVFILILLIISFVLRRQESSVTDSQPEPTIVNLAEVTITTNPNDIPATPPPQTGAVDHEFTDEQQNNIDQERALRRLSPYSATEFMVQYNFDTDLFDVTYNSASDSARIAFEEWRDNQYPAIPLDRFNRQN